MAAVVAVAAWLCVPIATSWGRSPVLLELVPFLFVLLDRALPDGQVDVKESVVVWPDGRRERFKLGHLGWSFGRGQRT